MRVVVCGSRDFDDDYVVTSVLLGIYQLEEFGHGTLTWSPFVVIDGQCPYGGADQLAYQWTQAVGPHPGDVPLDNEWMMLPVKSERFPPESNTARHFHERNRAMIDSGADLCVAFINKPLAESRGTKSTVEYARSKGVKTIVVEVH